MRRYFLIGLFVVSPLCAEQKTARPLLQKVGELSSESASKSWRRSAGDLKLLVLPDELILFIPLQKNGNFISREASPGWWVIDFPENAFRAPIRNVKPKAPIESLHSVPRKKGVALELHLKQGASRPIFDWKADETTFKIHVPLRSSKPSVKMIPKEETQDVPIPLLPEDAPSLSSPVEPVPVEPVISAKTDEPLVTRSSLPRTLKRIVIDPGHGGKDPGAIGARGTLEKDVNLQVALDLADALREQGYEVVLTRMDDRFLKLEERAQMANQLKADLFLSLHCNAAISSRATGFEIYFLAEDASDPHAAAVAKFENAPLALESRDSSIDPHVSSVLRSLARNEYLNESSRIGALMDISASRQLSQKRLGVKQAAFYVLRGAEMPALLIEMAFITNSKDEKRLLSKEYRQSLIALIQDALGQYNNRERARL